METTSLWKEFERRMLSAPRAPAVREYMGLLPTWLVRAKWFGGVLRARCVRREARIVALIGRMRAAGR